MATQRPKTARTKGAKAVKASKVSRAKAGGAGTVELDRSADGPELPAFAITQLAERHGITPMEAKFVLAYCGPAHFNGTKAAKMAGYAPSWAHVAAHQLLKNPKVKQAKADVTASFAMDAEECLNLIAQQARARYEDVCNENGVPSLQAAIAKGTDHLIRKVTPTKAGDALELVDSQAALKLIGSHLGLWVERHRHEGTLTLEQLEQLPLEELERMKREMQERGDA